MAIAAVLLFAAPVALAGVTPATTTLKAPYTKASVVLTSPNSMAGCGSFTVVHAPFFNKTTGIGGFSDNATTKWCSANTNNSAQGEGKFEVILPVHVTVNGSHTITAVWDTVAVGSENLTAGTCSGSSVTYSGCTRFAKTFVYGYAFLLDKTVHKKTASSKWAGNFAYSANYTSCVYTSCSSRASGGSGATFGGSFFWAWYWNGTQMNWTHKYVLQMFIFGGASVELMASTGATLSSASADAQLNSASGGNDEQLVSVTIT